MDEWGVISSHDFRGVITSIEINNLGFAVSNDNYIHFLNLNGKEVWKKKLPFKPYRIKSNEELLGVLMGNGFIVLNSKTGEQLHEGRSTQGGFSEIIDRPGGGWILTDRHEKIHIFNQKGFGIKRLFSGRIRKLLGWIDREHLLIHDGDGCLRCIRLLSKTTQRQIEENIWSWASELKNGEVILQSLNGNLMKGKPNVSGWDSLENITDKCIDPFDSTWTKDGWWILNMENKLFNLENFQEFENFGDLVTSDEKETIIIANKKGILRIIASKKLIKERNKKISIEFEKYKFNLDTIEKQHIFKMAKQAELAKDFVKANNLYNSIGIKLYQEEE